jgi:hypothetical protein
MSGLFALYGVPPPTSNSNALDGTYSYYSHHHRHHLIAILHVVLKRDLVSFLPAVPCGELQGIARCGRQRLAFVPQPRIPHASLRCEFPENTQHCPLPCRESSLCGVGVNSGATVSIFRHVVNPSACCCKGMVGDGGAAPKYSMLCWEKLPKEL